MKLPNMIPGFLRLEMTCADPEEALDNLVSAGIFLSDIQRKTDLTFHCRIQRQDYGNLSGICEKQGYSLKILSREGQYWSFIRIFNRPCFLTGFIAIFLMALLLPTRVLFIQVEGNQNIPTQKILSCAQECGISFFASRKNVRSEQVKNALLFSLPELEWLGVNTAGCVATISVRERMTDTEPEDKSTVSSIVADRDGYLLSVTVTSGNPLCSPGQYVTKGQLLVSGYTDCGIFIQATQSNAEILAQTARRLEAIRLSKPLLRGDRTRSQRKYSLLLGKKRINLWKDSGIWDTTCGRIYEEKYATLPGGFQLPLALCVEEYIFYDCQPTTEEPDCQIFLSAFAEDYLSRQMTAGIIVSKEEVFTFTEESLHLAGSYVCQEMIGRVKHEQIGEEHVKNH